MHEVLIILIATPPVNKEVSLLFQFCSFGEHPHITQNLLEFVMLDKEIWTLLSIIVI